MVNLRYAIRSLIVAAALIVLSACGVPETYSWPKDHSGTTFYGGFSINREGTKIAFHYYEGLESGGRTRYRIAVYDLSEKRLLLIEAPNGLSDWHSPSFGSNGLKMSFVSTCLSVSASFEDLCDSSVRGARIGVYDFDSGEHKLLTDSGIDSLFWSKHYQDNGVYPVKAHINRTHPIISKDGQYVFYLTDTFQPLYFSRAHDFAVRRVGIDGTNDEYLMTANDGVVFFVGGGGLAPHGENGLVILGRTGRGGDREEYLRSTKTFGYFYSLDKGLSKNYLRLEDLEGLQIRPVPRSHSLVGSFDRQEIFFIADNQVIKFDGIRLEVVRTADALKFHQLTDLALSADGKHLAVFGDALQLEQGSGHFWIIDTDLETQRRFDIPSFNKVHASREGINQP